MNTIPANEIPSFDLSEYDRDPEALATALGDGFRKWGFAGVHGHGLDERVVARAFAALAKFAALPDAVKAQYHLPGEGGQRGYTGFGVETAKDSDVADLKEFWQTGRELPADHPYRAFMADNVWPAELPEFEPAMRDMYEALEQVSRKILRALETYLALPEGFFDDATQNGDTVLRSIHYPPTGDLWTPAVRAGAHEDICVITLLVGSEEPGLEILRSDGTWVPVTTVPGTIMVNIGDMLERLTNHVLPSTTHRVVNPVGEARMRARYSIPLFAHFRPDFVIRTLESCISEDNPDRYAGQDITARDFLFQRLREIGLIPDERDDSHRNKTAAGTAAANDDRQTDGRAGPAPANRAVKAPAP